jgi:hypothetical protein
MPTSRDRLLRLLRTPSRSQPDSSRPRLLAIDDVVEMMSGHPVDLLPDRKSSTLAAWLDGRPEVEVICPVSGRAYAEAATQAAPRDHGHRPVAAPPIRDSRLW